MVEMTASHIHMISRTVGESLVSPSQEIFVFKLFGCTLSCLTHLLKSGLFITLNFALALMSHRSVASNDMELGSEYIGFETV